MPDVEREESVKIQRKPRYLQVLIAVFVVPVFFLLKIVWKYVQPVPFIISLIIISLIGWTWSSVLTALHWWEFFEKFIVGIKIIPFLPLEEFLFYPLGGFLLVFLYEFGNKTFAKKFFSRKILINLIYLITLFFIGVAVVAYPPHPYYLYSQFAVYNLLSLILVYQIGNIINLISLGLPVICLSVLGFFWDFLAFKYGWWAYHAATKITVKGIPVDDFNFYLFAPLAGISIYIFLCRVLIKNEN